jgi:hypothetical protein
MKERTTSVCNCAWDEGEDDHCMLYRYEEMMSSVEGMKDSTTSVG